jgi:hypothetical protein
MQDEIVILSRKLTLEQCDGKEKLKIMEKMITICKNIKSDISWIQNKDELVKK